MVCAVGSPRSRPAVLVVALNVLSVLMLVVTPLYAVTKLFSWVAMLLGSGATVVSVTSASSDAR